MAIGAMVTPTLFALQVLVVSGPKWQPRARAVVIGTAGVFAVYFALILGGMSQLPDAGSGTKTHTEYVIEFVSGVLVVAVSVWMLRPHQSANEKMKQKVESYTTKASPAVYAGIAAYMSVTDFSTLALMLPALHDVTSSATHIYFKAIIVAFVFVSVLVPVLGPPAAVRLRGQQALDRLHRLYEWLMSHQMQVMGAVMAFIGVILLWRGARGAF